jgi:hypothetical protein
MIPEQRRAFIANPTAPVIEAGNAGPVVLTDAPANILRADL